jgi:formylglycine-generating enzyme required for sulfatase activity
VVHSNQLIHRDVKPANVMRRRRDDRLVLIDFGGVKEVATAQYSQARLVPTPPTFWIGTPGYLAPEQALGEAQYQSDLYSVGVIGLQALLGRGPGQIPGNLARGVFDWEQIQRLMPMGDRLRQLLQKLTNHDWQQRYPDGQAALEAIESLFFSSAAPTVRIGSPPPPLPIVPPREGVRTRLGRWLFGSEVDPFAGWNLQEWSFETVRVDRTGRIVKRSKKTARSHLVDLGGGVWLELVAIPGGQFQMGSPATELERLDSEGPVRTVTVPPLLVSRYPVTVEQWRRVAGSFPAVLNPQLNADPSKWKDATGPVERVNWFDAMEFCARLSKATNRLYRLPTEAEWEYACRAGTQTPFAFGETLTPELANYDGDSTYADGPKGEYRNRTIAVGQFPPNRFGLQDMHGNVWEWCMDDWHDSYANAPSRSEARFRNENHSHVFNSATKLNNYQERFFQEMVKVDNIKLLRGGSWDFNLRNCRSAVRYDFSPDNRSYNVDFRVCCAVARTS